MMDLTGKVALVAGGTRGASRAIAVELGRAGAFVYVTGRSSATHRSEVDRPETIEQTLGLIEQAGGKGAAIRVDHLDCEQVAGLADRIEHEQDRLDILVDGIWGGDQYLGWGKAIWEHRLEETLQMLRLGIDAHLITSHYLFPLIIRNPGGLVVEMTDGTEEYNANYRSYGSLGFYLAKATSHPLVKGEAYQTKDYGTTVVAVTPGWIRSEAMLEGFGVTEANWRDATKKQPYFVISESPTFTGRGVVALAMDPDKTRFSGQTLSSGQLAKIYEVDDIDGSRPDCWRYIDEVQDLGKDPDPTGYR